MTTTNNPTTHRDWFKSSYSTNAASCVEVRFHDDLVQIRDSKHPRNPANPTPEPIISTTPHDWAAFLDKITGRTTHTNAPPTLNAETTPTGTTILRTTHTNTILTFTPTEWHAFQQGAHAHEFNHPHHPTATNNITTDGARTIAICD